MRALVLAAGWGTRLGAAAEEHPKALVPIGGRRALDWSVDAADLLPEVDAIDVLANAAQVEAFHAWAEGRSTRATLRVWSNGVAEASRSRGAIGDLARFVGQTGLDDDLLVLGGDNLFDLPLGSLARGTRRDPCVVVVDLGSPDRVRRYASVGLSADGRVNRLVEKDPKPPDGRAVTALYGIPRARLSDLERYLREGGPDDPLGHLVAWWCAQGLLHAVQPQGRWVDIGSPEDLVLARREFGGGGA